MLARANWGIRRSIGGQPELVLLDAGLVDGCGPWALKKPRRGERLPRPPEQAPGSKSKPITRLLAQGLLSDGVWGGSPSGPRRGGGQLVEVPDPAACGGDCSHSGQLCPPAEGLRHGQQTKTSEEVKAKLEKSLGRVTQTCKFQEETVKCN